MSALPTQPLCNRPLINNSASGTIPSLSNAPSVPHCSTIAIERRYFSTISVKLQQKDVKRRLFTEISSQMTFLLAKQKLVTGNRLREFPLPYCFCFQEAFAPGIHIQCEIVLPVASYFSLRHVRQKPIPICDCVSFLAIAFPSHGTICSLVLECSIRRLLSRKAAQR